MALEGDMIKNPFTMTSPKPHSTSQNHQDEHEVKSTG